MNEQKERNGCITAWLWLAAIVQIISVLIFSIILFKFENVWVYGLCNISSIFTLLGVILLLKWNKYGYYIMVVSQLATSIIIYRDENLSTTILTTAITILFASLVWFLILQVKKNGVSAWKLMTNGWDYKHCRHLYQLFMGLAVIFLLITVYASGKQETHGDFIIDDNEEAVEEIPAYDGWETFTDKSKSCSVDVPSGFREEIMDENQILGLICTDNDPAVIITRTSIKEASSSKEFSDIWIKKIREDKNTSFKKISGDFYQGKKSDYLTVFELTIDEDIYIYHFLVRCTTESFYCCEVLSLKEIADSQQDTIYRILNSFTIKDKENERFKKDSIERS